MSSEQEIFDKYGRTYNTGTSFSGKAIRDRDVHHPVRQGEDHQGCQGRRGEDPRHPGSGRFLREMAVIDKEPRSANAIAQEAAHLIVLDEEVFEMHMQTNPKIVRRS